ncbi:MAG: ABC transporter substrate-binding protein [Reyranella sp.]|nr:ABC transporter substrate-binding protein [Reyranella sp.]MBL6651227.1 ABC transporter substrate-binding protein [Reyranella sp.]
MNRRSLLQSIGGLALTAPSIVRAQAVRRIGYLSLGSAAAEATRFDAFRSGLAALGYVDGKNLAIETRWLDGAPYDRLAELAQQLVALKVEVIVTYATPGVTAAKKATSTIPIVFATVGDAVAVGLVASLARPGGNVTGTSYFLPQLAAKRLELLKEAIPALAQSGVLFNPANRSAVQVLAAVRETAQSLKVDVSDFPVRDAAELEQGIAAMTAKAVTALVVPEDPMLIYASPTIAKLALAHRLASCGVAELAQAGGLMAYGIDFVATWRHAATYVDKILKGANPGDIPVEQATQFRLELNQQAARALGVSFPATLVARADNVVD